MAELNRKYPGRIHVLPAGLAMTELVRRFARKELPGVDALMVSPAEKAQGPRVGLYRDKIHPTSLIAAMQGYLYYACLYRSDPRLVERRLYPDEKFDRLIREVVRETVTRHPRSGVAR